jgi:hypothetical protein
VNANRPTRATTDGRAYLDLQNLARRNHRPTDEYVQFYALEGMLARLTSSDYADKFVLKGGALLAAYQTRRPTRNIDLAAAAIPNEAEAVLRLIRQIALIPMEDGLTFCNWLRAAGPPGVDDKTWPPPPTSQTCSPPSSPSPTLRSLLVRRTRPGTRGHPAGGETRRHSSQLISTVDAMGEPRPKRPCEPKRQRLGSQSPSISP